MGGAARLARGLASFFDARTHPTPSVLNPCQNFFLYFYGALFNLLGAVLTCFIKGEGVLELFEGQSLVTAALIVNNAAQVRGASSALWGLNVLVACMQARQAGGPPPRPPHKQQPCQTRPSGEWPQRRRGPNTSDPRLHADSSRTLNPNPARLPAACTPSRASCLPSFTSLRTPS
jgi:hypothetical protein